MVERRGAHGLKALSARVVRAAPDDVAAYIMRAVALSGHCSAREVGPRSVVELKEAATHYERAAALHPAQAMKAQLVSWADRCSRLAESHVNELRIVSLCHPSIIL